MAPFPIAEAFLQGADRAGALLESAALAERWDRPSALAEFSVRGLAGHLARSVIITRYVVEDPEPDSQALDAARTYADAVQTWPSQAGAIRERGEASAGEDPVTLAANYRDETQQLAALLEDMTPSRRVTTKGRVLTLEDYLVTRAVELLVHADDMAVSLGLETPDMPEVLVDAVLAFLVASARARHGDVAVLRALTRRERDAVEALRVM